MTPRASIMLDPRDLIGVALDDLDASLVPRAARDALIRLPRAPGALFSFGCVECRLDEDPRVDFLACALEDDGGRIAAAYELLRGAHLGKLLSAWGRTERASDDVSGVWMEWDWTPEEEWCPFAFVRLSDRWSAIEWTHWRMARLLSWLGGVWDVDRLVLSAAAEAQRVLPVGGRVFHVATQSPRGIETLRMHVGLPKRAVAEFATALGWKGELGTIERWLEAWPSLPDPIGMQFDVGADHSLERIDLEFFLDTSPAYDDRWCELRESLARADDAIDEKVDAALAWASARERLGQDGSTLLKRTSFKVTIEPEAPPRAKAYLGFSPRRPSSES